MVDRLGPTRQYLMTLGFTKIPTKIRNLNLNKVFENDKYRQFIHVGCIAHKHPKYMKIIAADINDSLVCAERRVIESALKHPKFRGRCVMLTWRINRSGVVHHTSKPCKACAAAMLNVKKYCYKADINNVFYAVRDGWKCMHPKYLNSTRMTIGDQCTNMSYRKKKVYKLS